MLDCHSRYSQSLGRFQANCAVANTSELAAAGEIPSLSSFLEAFDLEARLLAASLHQVSMHERIYLDACESSSHHPPKTIDLTIIHHHHPSPHITRLSC